MGEKEKKRGERKKKKKKRRKDGGEKDGKMRKKRIEGVEMEEGKKKKGCPIMKKRGAGESRKGLEAKVTVSLKRLKTLVTLRIDT